MRKPSVVFFNRVYPPGRGATGRVLRDLARGFARDGWDVTVITTGPQSRKERDGAVRVLRIGISCRRHKGVSFYLKIWMRMLVAGLSMSRPDLIVTMTDPPLFVMAGRIIARMKKCRHMHWCQDLYPDLLPAIGVRVPPKAMQYFKINSRRAMKGCDKVVVMSSTALLLVCTRETSWDRSQRANAPAENGRRPPRRATAAGEANACRVCGAASDHTCQGMPAPSSAALSGPANGSTTSGCQFCRSRWVSSSSSITSAPAK